MERDVKAATIGTGGALAPPKVAGAKAAKPLKLATLENNPAILQLLDLEAQAREARTTHDLALVIANETQKLTRARQIFVCEGPGNGHLAITAATGLAVVDKNAPLIHWIEQVLERARAETDFGEIREFVLQAYSDPDQDSARTYPFREALWLPLRGRDGSRLGGVLLARETPWLEHDHVLARRLAATFSHAWSALAGATSAGLLRRPGRKKVMVAVLLCAMVGAVPVSMSTLAPFEVAPREAYLVTAPIDGVIEDVLIAANTEVQPGQDLVRFVDTTIRNRAAVAEREAQVAEARVKQAMVDAFHDTGGRHEGGILRAELAVKNAELAHARELLTRTRIAAARPGIAVFGDKRELIGRPVSIGERLMDIADPGNVELRIDIPVGDAIILSTGARVKAFLDSDPLRPRTAKVVRADYQAKAREGGILAFRVVAELEDGSVAMPRLGIRGTAQLYGSTVPLIYYLLRRPISKVRQWTGI